MLPTFVKKLSLIVFITILFLLSVQSVNATSSDYVTDGLVLFLNGTHNGATMEDLSGNNNDGTVTDATYTTSITGAIGTKFNGVSTNIIVPNSASIDLTDAFTLEAYCYVNQSNTTATYWIMAKNVDALANTQYGFYYDYNTASIFGVVNGVATQITPTGSCLVGNKSIILTYDGTNMISYLNGVYSMTVPFTKGASNSANIQIGRRLPNNSLYKETLYAVRIYNKVLSASEAMQNYRNSRNVYITGHNGGICLTYDDRRFGNWISNQALFAAHNAKATFFISYTYDFNVTEISNLQALSAYGHEIGTHSYSHQNATAWENAGNLTKYLDEEITPSISYLNGFGSPVTSFAYPYGSYTEGTDEALLNYGLYNVRYSSLLTLTNISIPKALYGFNGERGIESIYYSGQPWENITRAMDWARDNCSCLVLVNHDITDSTELENILAYAETNGLTFYTFSELVDPVNVNFTISAPVSTVTEADTTINIVATKTGLSRYNESVSIITTDGSAIAPGDFTALNTSLTFTPLENSKAVVLSIKDNTQGTFPKKFRVQLSGATGNATIPEPSYVEVTITYNPSHATGKDGLGTLSSRLLVVVGVFFLVFTLAIFGVALLILGSAVQGGDARGAIRGASMLPGIVLSIVISIVLIVVLIFIVAAISSVGGFGI